MKHERTQGIKPQLREVDTESLMKWCCSMLSEGNQVSLTVSGNSMSPFLVHHRDAVWLVKAEERLQRGDMILYKRANGDYVLHRICAVRDGVYDLVGDAQTEIEPGIRHEQVLARVCAVRRKGRVLQQGCFWWDFFAKIWVRVIPARTLILRIYTTIQKRKGRET